MTSLRSAQVRGVRVVAAVALLAVVTHDAPGTAQAGAVGMEHRMHTMSGGQAMDDAAMAHWVRDWYALHPAHGGAVLAGEAPADTFIASGTEFDADQNPGTAVDTAKIFAGQSILWKWSSGTHTTTNGTGAGDPTAGTLWDAPLAVSTPSFLHRFDALGSYPFFCRPHEAFGMKGVVVVSAPADTFIASGTSFDSDNNVTTSVDTAHISVGQAVLWRDLGGFHSVTNGTDSTDPAAGTLFDQPLSPDSAGGVFTYVFKTPGVFPFFCRPHEGFGMRGVVVVSGGTLAVPPGPEVRVGFASLPAPTPTQAGVTFRFALARAGHARAEVLDVNGRAIAVIVDGDFAAGVHPAEWNGRAADGRRVSPGVYVIRLALPGFSGAHKVVVTR